MVDGVLVVNKVVDMDKKVKALMLDFKRWFWKGLWLGGFEFLEHKLRRVGFCNKWVEGMKACVFRSNMYILVSGCHTEELSIQRGLKQCDPLAPFFFFW